MKNTHNTNMRPTYMEPKNMGPTHLGPKNMGPKNMGPKNIGPKIMGPNIMGLNHQKPVQVVIIRMHMLKLKNLNQKAFFHISPAFSKTQLSNIHILINHKKNSIFITYPENLYQPNLRYLYPLSLNNLHKPNLDTFIQQV